MSARGLRIGLVGPLPPPSGGMATQTRQLARLLAQEGVVVEVVQVNVPYRPAWVEPLRGIRALFRLVPYLVCLWQAAGRAQLFHVMANSGWAWHLYAAPAVWIAKLRHVPVVVNYRGGNAEEFFQRSIGIVATTMRRANRVIVPSGYLQQVFSRFGLAAEIVPNVVDLARFAPRQEGPRTARDETSRPHLIVTRNLEPIYGIEHALHAFVIVRGRWPGARITIAGNGPELARLEALSRSLGLDKEVCFSGHLDNDGIGELYRSADMFVNPSLVDNMPISILEALASGVPVISTDAGGIPWMVENGRTALLVPRADAQALALALLSLLGDPERAARLASAGRESVQQYSWQAVRTRLFAVYAAALEGAPASAAAGSK